MKPHPRLTDGGTDDIRSVLEEILVNRKNDISEFDNLKNTFISGRKVARIPTAATDTLPADQVGDFNIAYDGMNTYLYSLVMIGATAAWRRVMLTAW